MADMMPSREDFRHGASQKLECALPVASIDCDHRRPLLPHARRSNESGAQTAEGHRRPRLENQRCNKSSVQDGHLLKRERGRLRKSVWPPGATKFIMPHEVRASCGERKW